jgi:hypothetical protein
MQQVVEPRLRDPQATRGLRRVVFQRSTAAVSDAMTSDRIVMAAATSGSSSNASHTLAKV